MLHSSTVARPIPARENPTSNAVAACLIALCGLAYATGTALAAEYPTLYRGARPLGMGGAFLAVPDDSDAIFYNPASLAAAPDAFTLRLPLLLEVSQDTADLALDARDLEGDPNVDDAAKFLREHFGEQLNARAAFAPTAAFHALNLNVGLAVLAQDQMHASVSGTFNPVLRSEYYRDIGLLGAAALQLLGERVDLGVTAKFIQRSASIQVNDADDLRDGYHPRDDSATQSDFAFDIGLNYHLKRDVPVVSILNPIVSVVARNITQLDLVDEALRDLPRGEGTRLMPFQLDAGFSISPDIWVLKTIVAVQLDDVTRQVGPEQEDDNIRKRLHAGLEVEFPVLLALRVGYHTGYLSAGATIDFWLLEISYTSYAAEIGFDDVTDEDRRHVLELAFAF